MYDMLKLLRTLLNINPDQHFPLTGIRGSEYWSRKAPSGTPRLSLGSFGRDSERAAIHRSHWKWHHKG